MVFSRDVTRGQQKEMSETNLIGHDTIVSVFFFFFFPQLLFNRLAAFRSGPEKSKHPSS
jgi:hypothetical protein